MSQLLVSENSLTHYGIVGMHWGKRRRTVSKSKVSRPTSEPTSKPRRMSNKELTNRVKRLKLEKEFNQLTAVPPQQTVSKIEKLIKTAGTIATLTGHADTIYKNLNSISKMAAAGKAAS